MINWWHAQMVALTMWFVRRYVTVELAFHHSIITQVWYPFVVQQVRKAEDSAAAGVEKRALVVAATLERFRARGLPSPALNDIHLAIEYAVRDHAH